MNYRHNFCVNAATARTKFLSEPDSSTLRAQSRVLQLFQSANSAKRSSFKRANHCFPYTCRCATANDEQQQLRRDVIATQNLSRAANCSPSGSSSRWLIHILIVAYSGHELTSSNPSHSKLSPHCLSLLTVIGTATMTPGTPLSKTNANRPCKVGIWLTIHV